MRVDSLVKSAGIGIVAAVIAVLIVFLIADAASGPLRAEQPGGGGVDDIPLGGALFGTVIGGLVGTAIAAVAARLGRSVEVFLGACVVGLILYGLFALSSADNTSTGIWLNVMHLVAAVPIVGLLARWLQSRRAPAI